MCLRCLWARHAWHTLNTYGFATQGSQARTDEETPSCLWRRHAVIACNLSCCCRCASLGAGAAAARPVTAPSSACQVLLDHREDVKLESVVVAQDYLTVFERSNGLRAAIVYQLPKVGPLHGSAAWKRAYIKIQLQRLSWHVGTLGMRAQQCTVSALQCMANHRRFGAYNAGWRHADRARGWQEAGV